MLQAFCDRLGVPFLERMLSWEPGPRETDGIWSRHWYDAVHASTGFGRHRPKPDQVPVHLVDVHRQCDEIYETLYTHRLVA